MRTILITYAIIQLWLTVWLSYNETEAIEFKMTNLVCETFNNSWFVFNTCRLRAISRNKTCMYLNATVLHPAHNIHARFEVFQKANGYKPWLVNTTVDICRFVDKPFNPVVMLITKQFLEFSNFNHSCPYMGSQIIDGFYPRFKSLPHALPTGDYLLSITWLFNRREQFLTKVYFSFVEDLKANS